MVLERRVYWVENLVSRDKTRLSRQDSPLRRREMRGGNLLLSSTVWKLQLPMSVSVPSSSSTLWTSGSPPCILSSSSDDPIKDSVISTSLQINQRKKGWNFFFLTCKSSSRLCGENWIYIPSVSFSPLSYPGNPQKTWCTTLPFSCGSDTNKGWHVHTLPLPGYKTLSMHWVCKQ